MILLKNMTEKLDPNFFCKDDSQEEKVSKFSFENIKNSLQEADNLQKGIRYL
jgi:hypothetical protein